MGGSPRSVARKAVATTVSAAAGVAMITAMLLLDLDGGFGGALLWIVIAVATAALFTAILGGPQALVHLIRNGRPAEPDRPSRRADHGR